MTEKYEQILDIETADALMKEAAIEHQKKGERGYPPLIKLGKFGVWDIVARCTYNEWNKSFDYDGGIQSGGCDRSGGYKSINEVFVAAIKKAKDWCIEYEKEYGKD
jgi:hypothetical protein